jgi:hypothetical protein
VNKDNVNAILYWEKVLAIDPNDQQAIKVLEELKKK